jgi:hypothetical protein
MLCQRPPRPGEAPRGWIEEFGAWLHYTIALDPTHNQHAPVGQKDSGVIESCRDHLSGRDDAANGTTRGTYALFRAA